MRGAPQKAERKYLDVHAEPEAGLSDTFESAQERYGHVLAIPACGEGAELAQTLSSIPQAPLGPVLTILVINATPDAPTWIHESNTQTLEGLAHKATIRRTLAPNAALYAHAAGDLLVIDRATRENQLPTGQGVGLARKIGVDLALAMVLSDRVVSPWIHVSDADVRFPSDYFQQVLESADHRSGALLYRFRHRPGDNPRSYEAALQYEASLRYFVTGLRFARSKYAFQSIGSTLALQPAAYAQVRGFPRRRAAEDFYLLNKIAKVSRVTSLSGTPLELSSRVSQRVPFGTGAAIARMLEDSHPQRTTYHPGLFHHLRAWLDALEAAIDQRVSMPGSADSLDALVCSHAESDSVVDPGLLRAALEDTGALSSAVAALAAPVRTVRKRAYDTFDGFRTLKFLHALRDSGLPDLPLREALGRATFLSFPQSAESLSLDELRSRLEKTERNEPGEREPPSKTP